MRSVLALVVLCGLVGFAAADPVIWDNVLDDSSGLASAQNDHTLPLMSQEADDFILGANQNVVTDVHWIGGYWNPGPPPNPFTWTIEFYADDGTGLKPAVNFMNQYNVGTANPVPRTDGYFDYSTGIAPLSLTAGTKYWISIYANGDFPPQSGWGIHASTLLHMSVFRSAFFGFPNWVDSSQVFGAVDTAFQLTGIPEPASLLLLGLGALILRRR